MCLFGLNRTWARVCFAVVALILFSHQARAATPGVLNYQGRVLVNNAPFVGSGQFKFALVDGTGATTLWSNDNSSTGGGQPTNAVTLTVSNGLYSVLLGDTSIGGMTQAIPVTVFSANSDVRLRVWFNDGANGSKQLTPDQRIVSAGYAMTATVAETATTVLDGAIGTSKLADGSVTASKLAPGTIPSQFPPTGAAGGDLSGNYPNPTLASSVGTSANTANAIVKRDANGNFSAGTITGNFTGNVTGNLTGNVTGNTSGSAASFTGPLVGDVTGTQGSTVVSSVGGTTAANVAAGAGLANAATNLNTANTIVKRDVNGNFSAGTISGNLTGNATNVSGVVAIANGGTGSATKNFVDITTNQSGIAGNKAFIGTLSVSSTFTVEPRSSSTGVNNLFVGVNAGTANTTGAFNSFFGSGAGNANAIASYNSFFGVSAGTYNTNGNYNSFYGANAGFTNTTGSNNSFFGSSAGTANTTGPNNAIFGANAGAANTTGSNNAFFGASSGNANNANSNTFVGSPAGFLNTTGQANTFIGFLSGNNNTTGSLNTFCGVSSGSANTGSNNAFFGYYSGVVNTTGTFNAFFGTGSGSNNVTGLGNSFFGYQSGLSNTANYNSFFGNNAGVGNSTGINNSFYGSGSGGANSTGNGNSFYGQDSGHDNSTGSSNIGIGIGAGSLLTTGNNNIDIGHNGVAAEANTIRIGTQGTQTATFIAGISGVTSSGGASVYVNSNGQLGTATSSRRFKYDIQPMGKVSESILSMQPVTFKYKPELDPNGIAQFGLIAEEVGAVNPDLVVRDSKGEIYTVRYEAVNAMLLNEFLKEHQKVEDLQKRLSVLEERMEAMLSKGEKPIREGAK